MGALKAITTYRLLMLPVVFLLGNSFLLLPAEEDGCTDLYLLASLHSDCLLFTTLAAAAFLLYVRMALSSTEAKAGNVFRPELRVLLRRGISLSAISTFLAVFTFEYGFEYRKGRVSVISGWPESVLLLIMAMDHGCCTAMATYVWC